MKDRWYRLVAWACSREVRGFWSRLTVWLGFGLGFGIWRW
jgi:hypothetical protein